MTVTPDRLSEIARSLNRWQWQPTADEVAFGSTVFQRMKAVEEETRSTFPRGTDQWHRLHTENFDTLARVVAVVRDEVLPAGREQLADSPMVELAELYVSAAEPLLPHAQRLLAAWRDASLPAPTSEEVAREAQRWNVSAEQAESRMRFEYAAQWEEDANPRGLWDDLRPTWAHMGAVRSTMMAALTGDTDY
ncbi:hypothetical protein [Streptomyces graminilatus]|uniref:hypothetical protein n=1 Tax=Streptomyces graminilatus TaxID=1464070 RepID=UPI0007C666B3|nr:hypothetical protein [Streptomyces graminilatus]